MLEIGEVVDRYFASVRARDIEAFTALFAEEAVFILPDGRCHLGKPAIREMESAVFASAQPPYPTPNNIVASGLSAAVEVEVRLPDGACHRMGSFLTVDAQGLITRLSIYRQAS